MNVRALLLEHPTHDVDTVHEHRHVDDHHEDVGQHEGLALVAGLLASLAELEGLEAHPVGQFTYLVRVEPSPGQTVGDHDAVDRSFEHAE